MLTKCKAKMNKEVTVRMWGDTRTRVRFLDPLQALCGMFSPDLFLVGVTAINHPPPIQDQCEERYMCLFPALCVQFNPTRCNTYVILIYNIYKCYHQILTKCSLKSSQASEISSVILVLLKKSSSQEGKP